jgi:transposase
LASRHFFTRRKGFSITLCDLRRHKICDVVPGRSEAALATYFERLEGRNQVRLVCMDLSSPCRSPVLHYFPNARIVAGRFHVIRLINHHFLACWRELDPVGSGNRGLLSLMCRHRHDLEPAQLARLMHYQAGHPALALIDRFEQRLCTLLLIRHRGRKQCRPLAARLLKAVHPVRESWLAPLVELGETLHSWRNEFRPIWRFTHNNSVSEGFHTKDMEMIHRLAFGSQNFDDHHMRAKALYA